MCFCFLPVYGPVSTRQFLFFFLVLSGVPVHFIALYWYCSRSKEGNPDKNKIFWTHNHWTVMFIGGCISVHMLNIPSHKDSFFRNWKAYYITQDYVKKLFTRPTSAQKSHRFVWFPPFLWTQLLPHYHTGLKLRSGWKREQCDCTRDQNISRHHVKKLIRRRDRQCDRLLHSNLCSAGFLWQHVFLLSRNTACHGFFISPSDWQPHPFSTSLRVTVTLLHLIFLEASEQQMVVELRRLLAS